MPGNGSHGKSRGLRPYRSKTLMPTPDEIEFCARIPLNTEQKVIVNSRVIELLHPQVRRFYDKWGSDPLHSRESKG